MTILPEEIETVEERIGQAAERRKRKRKPTMRITGRSVFTLQQLAKKPRRRRPSD